MRAWSARTLACKRGAAILWQRSLNLSPLRYVLNPRSRWCAESVNVCMLAWRTLRFVANPRLCDRLCGARGQGASPLCRCAANGIGSMQHRREGARWSMCSCPCTTLGGTRVLCRRPPKFSRCPGFLNLGGGALRSLVAPGISRHCAATCNSG